MKYLFGIVLFFSMLFIVKGVDAQIPDPTTWTYEAKKKGGNEYEIIFHLVLKEGWHIWSMTPGGDGTLIMPSFTFDKNNKVQLKGKVKETGKLVTKTMEGIDGKVNMYSGKVDYTQEVIVSGSIKLKGKHEYQVCNDQMCLPPKEKEFSIEIGK
jgi:DsbC/DsbD-like thiol-disulfide interchange protein